MAMHPQKMLPMIRGPPQLIITEQPQQRGMRFRYECEGRSAGSIPGENSAQDRKTWPTVQVVNFSGEVNIRVSLVSKDTPPRPHPHSLVGKDCTNGICQVKVNPETQMMACFSNLGIQCVKRREVSDSLRERRRMGIDPFNTFQDGDTQAVDIDLNIVRLCFEAFIRQGNQVVGLTPVLSNPIFDKKATCSAILRICRVDRSYGSCKGGEEVYLLCDKVQKDDISICFFDVDTGWEAFGQFSPTDVHRQVAIVFRTPPYKSNQIRQATKVFFQLKRTSDGETSESKDFIYLPIHHDPPSILGKRPQQGSTIALSLRDHIKNKVKNDDGPYGQGSSKFYQPESQMFPQKQMRFEPPPLRNQLQEPGGDVLDEFMARFESGFKQVPIAFPGDRPSMPFNNSGSAQYMPPQYNWGAQPGGLPQPPAYRPPQNSTLSVSTSIQAGITSNPLQTLGLTNEELADYREASLNNLPEDLESEMNQMSIEEKIDYSDLIKTEPVTSGALAIPYPNSTIQQQSSSQQYTTPNPVFNIQPATPQSQYQQPTTPQSQYQQPSTPQSQFQQPSTPQSQFQQPTTPQSQFQQPTTPQSQFQQPTTPQSQFQQPSTPQSQFHQSATPQSQFQQPAQPQSQFQMPYRPEVDRTVATLTTCDLETSLPSFDLTETLSLETSQNAFDDIVEGANRNQ